MYIYDVIIVFCHENQIKSEANNYTNNNYITMSHPLKNQS